MLLYTVLAAWAAETVFSHTGIIPHYILKFMFAIFHILCVTRRLPQL